MKGLFAAIAIASIACIHISFTQVRRTEFIDPTGTYILRGTLHKNKITGHFGELRVKLIDPRTVAVCFYISNGYPNYQSGAILDTLPYINNQIEYRPDADKACQVFFVFTKTAAEIQQAYKMPHAGCGFADGVLVSTFLEKNSDEVPVIQSLSHHGIAGAD